MKVQNKGGKGNPNHDDVTGEFIAENGDSQQEEEFAEDSLSFKLDFDINSIDDFIGSIDFMSKREKDEQAQNFIDSLGSLQNIEPVDNENFEDKKNLLENSSFEYDKTKLSELTERQIDSLILAESICFASVKYEQESLLAEKVKQDLLEKQNKELKQESTKQFGSENGPYVSNIWYGTVSGEEFDSKNIPDENGKTAIDRKREYYENLISESNEIINDPLAFIDDVELSQSLLEDANKKIDALNKWVEDCQKYKELKNQIQLKYIDDIEQAEKRTNDLKAKGEYFKSDDYLGKLKLSKEYIGKFQDKNAAYSQFRKDNAVWFHDSQSATAHFGPIFDNKMWDSMSWQEQTQLVDYTGGGYSKYNKPLRGLNHAGWSGFNFANAVTILTNAIDKCVWDEDIWVQRGISDSKMFQLPGSNKLTDIGSLTDAELQKLVGMSFTDNGFYSAGAGKGTGFSASPIILNTYCPKGTKMAYMNTKGHYAHSSENEMILQRGYSYRIVKVERKGYKTYIDCEVILGSDENKITDLETLKKIGAKHL